MNIVDPTIITIEYDPVRIVGRFLRSSDDTSSPIWERLRAHLAGNNDVIFGPLTIEMPWPQVLGIIREYGSRSLQQSLNYRLMPQGEASERIKSFVSDFKIAKQMRGSLSASLSELEIKQKLIEAGFTRRTLKSFQYRDVAHLMSLPHGANFSVPGAGKTTVTLALDILTMNAGQHLLVVCPKSAFAAWRTIVEECIDPDVAGSDSEPFTILDGQADETERLLYSGKRRFAISYDQLIRQQNAFAAYMARKAVHVVLDESHRMKAGMASQRGAFLLGVAALPVRRDILSGTPMPQDANDLASQLAFLWPGHGLDFRIQRGETPRDVLGHLYVRTTKKELDIPPSTRIFYSIPMSDGQLALYGVVRSEALRQLTRAVNKTGAPDYIRARKSVMRLLQLSANPTLALQGMLADDVDVSSGIVERVIEESYSAKMLAVADHARSLASAGSKVVIWTIFTGNINDLEVLLADLNPVSLYGAVPSGSANDPNTREGRIRRFHIDNECKVIIANPAAAGEGISLHTVCHDAIYLDRSYVSTHYLQSIDRIHRLGLAPGTITTIHIYRTKAPAELGSIDFSVSRRLAIKIRNMQMLLEDDDLHELAFDEENADDLIDYNVEMQDLVDLIEELEGRSLSGLDEA